ncbi:MAG: ATP-binding protein [Betaproteobacteria bacterium]|nr:ATP-binding protein [Betaproteobacteria bacterium]
MNATQAFARGFESIARIFEFTSEFFARAGVDPRLLPTVDLVVEELFTNMVKYGAAADPGTEVRIDMASVEGGVEVCLTDFGVEPFDVTQVPDADTNLPIEQRRPGGLGLHLIRRLVDSWGYEHSRERRENRITFRKTLAGQPVPENKPTQGEA